MIAVFALAAMRLAFAGLYSLVTLVVTARTREIGVRMTLGAEPRQIVGQLQASVAELLAIGAASGVVLTWLASCSLRALQFGVSPMDAMTIAAAVLALGMLTAVAEYVPLRPHRPAIRASRRMSLPGMHW